MKHQNPELKIAITPAEDQMFIAHTSAYPLHPKRVPCCRNACLGCLIAPRLSFNYISE